MRRAIRHRSEGGFTLLEALVAFMIVATMLSAAYAGMSMGARSAHRAETALAALTRAEAAMARIGADVPLEQGRTVLRDGDWRTEIVIARHGGRRDALWSRVGAAPFEVTVSVENESGDAAGAELRTLRLAVEGSP